MEKEELTKERLEELIASGELPFGELFTPHSLRMYWNKGKGWQEPTIVQGRGLTLPLEASVLHYAGEIFEGMKAYHWDNGEVYLFRPEENFKRFNASAERMSMPTIPLGLLEECIFGFVDFSRDWVPRCPGYSLYIRPAMLDISPAIGLKPGTDFLFFVILSPSGPYFKHGIKPIRLMVTDKYSRSAPGGVGEAKTGGNYAASKKPLDEAKQSGYDQVLFLDCCNHRYIEECAAMNVFFVIEDTIVTPPLNGKILRGITRDSVLLLARSMGMKTEERAISIDEVLKRIEDGTLTEAATCGTAAIITPIGTIGYLGSDHHINRCKIGPITKQLYDTLVGIQYG
ncbi:branched chain amino acid aminotransferase, partial [Candidatus Woesearchaeota archaeon]